MRLLKERDVDQELYEALNFSMRDDEDLLAALDESVRQDVVEMAATAEADHLAGEAEERARTRAAAAEHELSMARHELKLAHDQRIAAKRLHTAVKARQERQQRVVKSLRLHTTRTRRGVVEWAGFKGFADTQLPDLQIMARGGLKRLVDAHKHATAAAILTEAECLSQSEAEAL